MNIQAILTWTIFAAIIVALIGGEVKNHAVSSVIATFLGWWVRETQVLAGNTTLQTSH